MIIGPRRSQSAFTLIEVLVVLAIMAVLAAVVIPSVRGSFSRGAEQAYETDRRTLQTVVETYFQEAHRIDGRADGDVATGHVYPTYAVSVDTFGVITNIGRASHAPAAPADDWSGAVAGAFIDMNLLVEVGLLGEIPRSAHACNCYQDARLVNGTIVLTQTEASSPEPDPTTTMGTIYAWYVDAYGNVRSAPTFEEAGRIYP
ncbi:MAG: type II secretion system protein [Chloroflexi bacterium]|nr:type II secretion system protein [Chloroflexota bacterium]